MNGCELRITIEPESLHEIEVFYRRCAFVASHNVSHSFRKVKFFSELVVVAHLHSAPNINGSFGRGEVARNHVEQRALARAIRTNNS